MKCLRENGNETLSERLERWEVSKCYWFRIPGKLEPKLFLENDIKKIKKQILITLIEKNFIVRNVGMLVSNIKNLFINLEERYIIITNSNLVGGGLAPWRWWRWPWKRGLYKF